MTIASDAAMVAGLDNDNYYIYNVDADIMVLVV